MVGFKSLGKICRYIFQICIIVSVIAKYKKYILIPVYDKKQGCLKYGIRSKKF